VTGDHAATDDDALGVPPARHGQEAADDFGQFLAELLDRAMDKAGRQRIVAG
jgi:hypothetical protein